MEVVPVLYIVGIGILADVLGSFRTIGGFGAFWVMFFLTPILGAPIVLLFPKLSKAYCFKDYKDFHAGVAYSYKLLEEQGKPVIYEVVDDTRVKISEYEFSEHFVIIESRREYKRRRKADGFKH